jgi:hypothetical protein
VPTLSPTWWMPAVSGEPGGVGSVGIVFPP